MDLSSKESDCVYLGGLLHDLGKLGVKDTILDKPNSLTEQEFSEVKRHPELGAKILMAMEELRVLVPLVKHHHEAFDGSGYPLGLVGQEIPLGARIICVADVYEAMTSDRPYRLALSEETARIYLLRYRGIKFDPDVVDAFYRILRGK